MNFSQLDSPSGHIIVGFVLLGVGAGFFVLQIPKAEDVILAGLTTITLSLKGLNGSKMTMVQGDKKEEK